MTIDWPFIDTLEGDELTGYVPDPNGSKSGVTIACGVDLSAETLTSIAGLPSELQQQLTPYLGLTGQDAVAALQAQPLTITQADADTLNAYVDAAAITRLTSQYDGASTVTFDALPDQAQTVIASVAFQYGNLGVRCPKFWGRAIVQDWPGCVAELRNFGDAYPSRRNKEADYLAAIIPTG